MAKNTAGKRASAAKPKSMKIKKGDRVVILAGKDKGREGTVRVADPVTQRVLVDGVSMIKKNTKVNYGGGQMRPNKEGGIVHQEAFVHVSNVALIDPESKKPARAGYRFDSGNKVRVIRPSGKDI